MAPQKDDEWVDTDWEDVPSPPKTVQPEQPWYSKAWHTLADPLTTAPSKWAHDASMSMTDPNNHPGWLTSFAGGALEGVGNIASSLTSPLSLATLGAGGLEYGADKAGLESIAQLANTGSRVASVPFALHGAEEMVNPESTWGQRAMGAIEAAGGGAGALHTPSVHTGINPSVTEASSGISVDDFLNQVSRVSNREELNSLLLPKPSSPQEMEIVKQALRDANTRVQPTDVNMIPSKARGLLPDVPEGQVDLNTPITKPKYRANLDGTFSPIDSPVETPAPVETPIETPPVDNSLDAIKQAQTSKTPNQQFVIYDSTGAKKILNKSINPHDYVSQGYLKDGESLGIETGGSNFQLLSDKGGQIPSSTKTAPSKTTQFLSRDLQGARPRFNIGTDSYTPVFANDLDKALYIIAQKNPSRRDADFLKFVMSETGLDETGARAAGIEVRKGVLTNVRGQEPGEISIPQLYGKTQSQPVTTITNENIPDTQTGNSGPPQGPPKAPVSPTASAAPSNGSKVPSVAQTPPVAASQVPQAIQRLNQQASLANPAQKAGLFQNAQSFIKTLLTAYDFSAPGRQGKGLITHKEFWTSFNDMFKAWGSDKASQAVKDSITNHPSGFFFPTITPKGLGPSIAEQAGLAIGEKGKPEMFGSQLAEKLPGVKASERAYTAFLTKARADVFAKLAGQAKSLGRGTPDVYKQIADSINISTGVGNLHGVEKSATVMKALNSIFFAPKLAASRVQMYTRVLNPKTYMYADPIVRKEALRSLFGVVGTGAIVGQIAKGFGAEVSNDPTSSDFRKIKIGNTRIDNFAGLQQYGVAAARLLSGESTSSVSNKTSDLTSPRYGGQTRQDVVSNFTNKLAPIPSFVWAWMGNKEFDGTPFDVKQAMLKRTVPLVMQDLYDIAKDDPSLIPVGLLPMFGEGVQMYGR